MIRAACVADVDAIAALEVALFGADQWSSGAGIVAEEDGVVVGYAAVVVGGDVADLARVAVTEPYRRRGIASALLAEATNVARTSGADRMLLEVAESNVGARDFYASHGFAEISRRRRYYADGDDAFVLARALG